MLTESLLLALLGGGFGIVLAFYGLDILKHIAPKLTATGGNIPGFDEIRLNPTVLGFTLALSLVTAILFGLIPAWRTSGSRFRQVLAECGARASAGRSRQRTLGVLVISQIALALILLTASALLVRSFARLANVNPGFVARGLLAVQMERPNTAGNRDSAARADFYQQLVDRLTNLSSVESVCAISLHPMGPDNYRTSFGVDDPTSAAGRSVNGEYRSVTTDFLTCMKIPLLKGRSFAPSDRTTGVPVAVVNQEFARKALWGQQAVGKSIVFRGTPRTIVGVVGNVKEFSLDERDAEPTVYEPIHQNCPHGMTILVRTTREPAQLAAAVRRAVWEIDPDQPILRVRTMDEVVGDTTSVHRFSMVLLAITGGVALLMAVAGIYALVAYAVNERAREIAIRMAFGAEEKDILRLAMRRGTRLAITGLGVGLLGALFMTRFMSALLFDISTTDPATFLAVPLILLIAALLACYLPARRAAKIDPMQALRYE
jgi:putative ABC transport system permease protein